MNDKKSKNNVDKNLQTISIDEILSKIKAEQDTLNTAKGSTKLASLLAQIHGDEFEGLNNLPGWQGNFDDSDEDYVSDEEFDEVTAQTYNAHCLYQGIQEKINEEKDIKELEKIMLSYLKIICSEMPDIMAQRIFVRFREQYS